MKRDWIHHGRRPAGLCGAGGGGGWEEGLGGDVVQVGGGWEGTWPLWYKWEGLGGDLLASVVQVGGTGEGLGGDLASVVQVGGAEGQ